MVAIVLKILPCMIKVSFYPYLMAKFDGKIVIAILIKLSAFFAFIG